MISLIRIDNRIDDLEALTNGDTRCDLSDREVLMHIDGASLRALNSIERLDTLENIRPFCKLLAG